jgi:glycosyltransferase involved in cell wall biosynthesis
LANGTLVPGLASIIVPVYNSERHLASCVESALGQSYRNIELLLIDDGSTDGSGKLCDAYARQDSRVRVQHAVNGGPALARNLGIEHSRGEFLFFLDSDDRIEPDAIRVLVENQQQTHADLVIGDFTIKHSGIETVDTRFLFPEDALFGRIDVVARVTRYLKRPTAYSFLTYVWGKLFRASLLKSHRVLFNPELRIFEDIDLNVRFLRYAESVSYVRSKLYSYTSYPNSIGTASGLHKYPLAYKHTLGAIQEFLLASSVPAETVRRDIGNARVHSAIRIMVALFRHGQHTSLWETRALISRIVNDPDLVKDLRFYSPAPGDSRTIPQLIRFKQTTAIMAVCRYKIRSKPSAAPQAPLSVPQQLRRISGDARV